MSKIIFTLVFAVFTITQTFSQGYRVGLQGNQALAMGHTGVAVVNNAETAFFNPAGLVYLEDNLNVSAGAFGIFSSTKWQNTDTGQFAETEDNISTPFYLYASYKITDWITAGIAAYTRTTARDASRTSMASTSAVWMTSTISRSSPRCWTGHRWTEDETGGR